MREIKFRAYRKDKGIMMYFGLDDIASTTAYNGWSNYIFKGDGRNRKEIDLIRDENVILMQYTGLKDKNGDKIYEGDICEAAFENRDNLIGIVKDRGCYYVVDGGEEYFVLREWLKNALRIEKIGNKYENTELLEDDEIIETAAYPQYYVKVESEEANDAN